MRSALIGYLNVGLMFCVMKGEMTQSTDVYLNLSNHITEA